jgi:hypothetical protein
VGVGSLLPALRDLRAYLASGCIWLLAGWIAFAPYAPDANHLPSALRDIKNLIDYFGKPIAVAGLVFSAYLAGVLIECLRFFLIKILSAAFTILWYVLLAVPIMVVELSDDGSVRRSIYKWTKTSGGRRRHKRKFRQLYGIAWECLADFVREDQAAREKLIKRVDLRAAKMIWECLEMDGYPISIRDASGKLYTGDAAPELPADVSTCTPEIADVYSKVRNAIAEGLESSALVRHVAVRVLVDARKYVDILRGDLETLPARLIITNQGSFERWDRVESESEFLRCVGLSLAALGFAFYIRGLWDLIPSFVFAGVAVFLLYEAWRKMISARQQLIGYISSRALESSLARSGTLDDL